MHRLFIAYFLFSHLLFANDFLISEVFANAPGRGSDHGKEWIELLNLSQPREIKSLDLEIYEQQGALLKLVIQKRIDLKKPTLWKRFMIIAQSVDLGIGACFDDVLVLVMPFSLKNSGGQKICASIDQKEKVCAKFPKKMPMPDGIALFRDPSDRSEEPLWRHEPCPLTDNIFATPGRSARDCLVAKDKGNLLCKSARRLTFFPVEKGTDGPFVYTACRAPKLSQKICHVTKRWTGHDGQELQGDHNRLLNPGEEMFLLKRSFHGAIERTPMMLEGEHFEKWPRVELIPGDGQYRIQFTLDPRQVPLNISILDENGLSVLEQAFVEAGDKVIEFSYPAQKGNFLVQLSDIHRAQTIFSI